MHYLPHHAVIKNERDTTKTRIVFDASSKIGNNPSLNDCLHSVPCLLPLIFDILLRFRIGDVALVADIKQAFLNIEIDEGDRGFLRFLWVENISEKGKIVVYRFLRVVFGVTSSPFLLGATIKSHVTKYIVAQIAVVALKKLLQDMYDDDLATSFCTMEEGLEFYFESRKCLKEGGFKLRKWNSNNKELMDRICAEENENSFEQGKNCLWLRKVLGINWDIEKDLFVFDFDEIVQLAKDLKFTKRNLLKINATLFDPLGLISPITLQGKLLFKLLCIDKSDWDDELDDIIKQKFSKFLNDLKIIKQISMSRFIYGAFKEQICNIELHCFCDSSLQAYSSVIYIRVITNLDVKVNLICSKTKVSPMKEVTIPRLELMSCALLTKLLQSVL